MLNNIVDNIEQCGQHSIVQGCFHQPWKRCAFLLCIWLIDRSHGLINGQKRASCIKSAAGLLPCSRQADIRMRSHRLLRLDDNKSAASCQQAWCKLIVKTFYPQASCKFFQQLTTSLQMSSCVKSDFHRQLMQLHEANSLDAIWWQTRMKSVESTTCIKSSMFLSHQNFIKILYGSRDWDA